MPQRRSRAPAPDHNPPASPASLPSTAHTSQLPPSPHPPGLPAPAPATIPSITSAVIPSPTPGPRSTPPPPTLTPAPPAPPQSPAPPPARRAPSPRADAYATNSTTTPANNNNNNNNININININKNSSSSSSSSSAPAAPRCRAAAPSRRRPVAELALLPLAVLACLLCAAAGQKAEYKFNAGGYAIAGYDTDPTSTVKGPNLYYRGPEAGKMTVGRSHRWGEEKGFTYQLPVGEDEAEYDVDLVFAEIYEPTAKVGARVFNVAIEGKKVLSNYDVFKEAGAINKEVTATVKKILVTDGKLTIAFMRGPQENPMVSALRIRRSDGAKFEIKHPTGSDSLDVEGTGKEADAVKNKGFDHQAHSIAGGPYEATDFNDDGTAEVTLDGSGSHSHYFDPETETSGKIVRYLWTTVLNNKKIVLGKKKVTKAVLPVTNGAPHKVTLEVEDQLNDVAVSSTLVTIKPATSSGAYCYYYEKATDLPKKLDAPPKPVEGYSTNIIDFSEDEFQYSKKSSTKGTNDWAMRCMAEFYTTNTTEYNFALRFRGKGAALWIDGGLKAVLNSKSNKLQTIGAKIVLPIGRVPMQIMYYAGTEEPTISLLADGKVAAPNLLSYKAAEVIPTISSISTDEVRPSGGGSMTIIGTGFFNKLKVTMGKLTITSKETGGSSIIKISGTEIILRGIPSESATGSSGSVSISIENGYGKSNEVTLKYTKAAKAGIVWEQTFLKDKSGNRLSIKQVTGVKVGPDQNYYLSSLSGRIYKLRVGRNLQVGSSCQTEPLGRPILGIAFDYGSKFLDLYATSSSLYWFFGGKFKNQPEGWANGAVERFRGTNCKNKCICRDKQVVTGLPVSNHDHGVNGIEIKDGWMYVSNGGATNAGHNTPGNKLGGWPESPLSAAVITANFRKPGFDGAVKYNQYTDPESAKQTSGDVSVYSAGLRNSFGITMRLNGELWATDNGGNPGGYGDRATGCKQTDFKPFKGKDNDKIIKLVKGGYFGHPNRARKQCSPSGALPANLEVVSATSGIAEYTANTFKDSLLNHLIFTKYAAEGSGLASHSPVGGNGKIELKRMADYSGVAVTTGIYGELVMPRVQQGFIAVLRPDTTPTGSGPYVVAVAPPRGTGGKVVWITGFRFAGSKVSVTFGSQLASGVKVIDKNTIQCTVPGGKGKVGVSVTIDGISSKADGEAPFRYEG